MDTPAPDYVVPPAIAGHPAWHRLDDQQAYYSKKSSTYQTHYKRIKLALITLSAAIPLLVFIPGDIGKVIAGVSGVAIAVLEGILLLNQYSLLWVNYRSTSESLKRERWLLLSRAGEYTGLSDEEALRHLAGRVETLLQVENAEWVGDQKQAMAQLARTREWVEQQRNPAPPGVPLPDPAPPAADPPAAAPPEAAPPVAPPPEPAAPTPPPTPAPDAPPAPDSAPPDQPTPPPPPGG